MKKYISPKADFIAIGNTDILTASFGITTPFIDFGPKASQTNSILLTDNSIKDKNDVSGAETMYEK